MLVCSDLSVSGGGKCGSRWITSPIVESRSLGSQGCSETVLAVIVSEDAGNDDSSNEGV